MNRGLQEKLCTFPLQGSRGYGCDGLHVPCLFRRISEPNVETDLYPSFCQNWRHKRMGRLPSSTVTHWQKPDSCLLALFVSSHAISDDIPVPDCRCGSLQVPPLCTASLYSPGSQSRSRPGCRQAEMVPARWECSPSPAHLYNLMSGHPPAFLQ